MSQTKENIPHIILKRNQNQNLSSPLDKLANFMGLLPYGIMHLSQNAKIHLRMGTIMLLIVFIFDLTAWNILINLIINKGYFNVYNITNTLISFTFSLLLSLTTIIFEITIFTEYSPKINHQWQWLKKIVGWFPILDIFFDLVRPKRLIRILIVLMSAYFTAQPLHIIFFDSPIEKRARAEQAILHASIMSKDAINKKDRSTSSASEVDALKNTNPKECNDPTCIITSEEIRQITEKLKPIEEKKKIHEKKIQENEDKIKGLEEEISLIDKTISRLNDDIIRIRKQQKKEDELNEKNLKLIIESKKKKMAQEKDNKKEKLKSIEVSRSIISNESLEIKNLEEGEMKEVYEEREKLRKVFYDAYKIWIETKIAEIHVDGQYAGYAEQIYRRFIMSILTNVDLKMGSTYKINEEELKKVLNDITPKKNEQIQIQAAINVSLLEFHFRQIDFFEKIRILKDLINGTSTKWPDALDEMEVKYLEDRFKLKRIPSDIEQHRLKMEGDLLKVSNIIIYLIGFFIPMMALLYKAWMNEELNLYYANQYQAYLGHTEAMLYLNYLKYQNEEEHQSKNMGLSPVPLDQNGELLDQKQHDS
jgi:hypothetical protein